MRWARGALTGGSALLGFVLLGLAENAMQAAAVRRLELSSGALVGFKAAPGASCDQLFVHSLSFQSGASDPQESPTPDWSGIYVQLGMEQAVRYVPNQFDRGEPSVSVVALRVRQGRTLQVLAVDDPRMADTATSSADKANIVRQHVTAVCPDLGEAPLLTALGQQDLALCLLDSEDYELAVPHRLFSEDLLEAETLVMFQESQRCPSTVGKVTGVPDTSATAVEAAVAHMSKGDLSDVCGLSSALKGSMEAHGLPTAATWFDN
jgi:hypothetical protein